MTGESVGMAQAWRSTTELLLASDVAYGEGPVCAVVVLVLIFWFVAKTDEYWFVGMGLAAVLVTALFIYFSWQSMADYPLTYRDGDHPQSKVTGTGAYETWELGSEAAVSTTFDVVDASDAQTLAGELTMEYGCPAAKVDWHIYAGDDLVGSGTLHEGQERDLTENATLSKQLPEVVRLTAARSDSAACKTRMHCHNPGFEGPGNGEFRFLFAIPGD